MCGAFGGIQVGAYGDECSAYTTVGATSSTNVITKEHRAPP